MLARNLCAMLVICGVMTPIACSRRQPIIIEEIEPIETEPIEIGSENGDWIRVEDDHAEFIVAVEFHQVNRGLVHSTRLPFARNPEAKSRGLSQVGMGWTACGEGGGCGGSISISGHDDETDSVKVDASFRWSHGDKDKGSVAGIIEVPWMGQAEKNLGPGISLRVSFRKTGKAE